MAHLKELLSLAKDPADLKDLLSLVRDTSQLKRLLELMATNPYASAAPLLKDFLSHISNPNDLERLIEEAGLRPPPDPDAYRLARVLEHMGPGHKAVADVEMALRKQKDLDNKILFGRQKDPSKLTGDGRTIIGGHSPEFLSNPLYQIASQTRNSDGTISVKFTGCVSFALKGGVAGTSETRQDEGANQPIELEETTDDRHPCPECTGPTRAI